jgi:hypothetical protein
METFLPDTVKAILLGLIVIAFALARLARALPHVAWLQVFRLPVIQMSEEQRARRRRSANRLAGLEIIVAGLALPLLYFVSTIMLFNEPKTPPTIIVTACSLLYRPWDLDLRAELLAPPDRHKRKSTWPRIRLCTWRHDSISFITVFANQVECCSLDAGQSGRWAHALCR